MTRIERAIAAIDAANSDDPNTIEVRGEVRPKELAHAELMTEWVSRFRPDSDEALLLAARAHHIRRWTVARTDFPTGRAGYHRWRNALHDQHAADIGNILATSGYDPMMIERVQALVAKRDQPSRGVSEDRDVRALEDALCLVFLETQLRTLKESIGDEEKMRRIVSRALAKMSPDATAAALNLPLTDDDRALIQQATNEDA